MMLDKKKNPYSFWRERLNSLQLFHLHDGDFTNYSFINSKKKLESGRDSFWPLPSVISESGAYRLIDTLYI